MLIGREAGEVKFASKSGEWGQTLNYLYYQVGLHVQEIYQ